MANSEAKDLYLELLKKTILYEIWVEYEKGTSPEARRLGQDWPVLAHSMIGRLRMDNLHDCMASVITDNVPGDFIETGAWRGGACIFMRGFLKAHGITDRSVWVADSFEGLPPPDVANYPADHGARFHTVDYLKVSLEEVQKKFPKIRSAGQSSPVSKGMVQRYVATRAHRKNRDRETGWGHVFFHDGEPDVPLWKSLGRRIHHHR